MTRPGLFTVASTLSLLLCAGAVVAMCVFPKGIARVVYEGTLGWEHGDGFVVAGMGLYELHAIDRPVVILDLPRGLLNAAAFTFALAPAAWLALRHLDRPRAGLCPRCGYDLRASPVRCPECGAGVDPIGGRE